MILPQLAPPIRIAVEPGRVLNRITPSMYGACMEDVNHEVCGFALAQAASSSPSRPTR